jgi:hypothetical protein
MEFPFIEKPLLTYERLIMHLLAAAKHSVLASCLLSGVDADPVSSWTLMISGPKAP